MAANRLTRRMLGEFLKSPETIRAFESLDTGNSDLEAVVAQMRDAAVLVLSLTDAFTNQRVVTSDGEVEITDGGAGGNLTFGLSDTGATAGTYGSATQLARVAVNAKGRITLASSIALNSDNVTEGSANLFFTTARARAALSNGTGISYNSGTGVIALANTAVAAGSFGSPTEVGTFTVDAQGRLTAASNVAISIGAASVSGVALTKVDDTNITLTLGGSPATALVAATSLTLGWAGTLAVARGGTGGGVASGTLLDNISGFASTGHIVRTGAGAYSFRTVTGTANQIDVANGSGVSGNPTISISASYVGQASITTLGTIATGVWQGAAVGAAYGGTGQSSYTTGDLLYASAASTLSKLAGVATGNALISGGVSTAPSWGKIGLTTHISGTLAVGNGGTGVATLTSGYLVKGNGASAVSASVIYDDGANLGIGNSSPAAKVDVSGNLCVSTGGYFYTPYNGTTNTGTVRAGVQMDGTSQTLNFYTANSFRGAVDASGNMYLGGGSTTIASGFFYIPSGAGAPTGAPTSISGRVPMYYDSTNNDFYVYNGAWKKVHLA